MKISIRLFVQRLADGSYTVTAPLVSGVSASGPDLAQCKQEMAAALAEPLAAAEAYERDVAKLDPDERLERVEVELQPRAAEGVMPAPVRLAMNLMVIPDPDGGLRVTVPRLTAPPIFYRVSGPSQLEAVSRAMLIVYFQDYIADEIAKFAPSPEEWFDEVEVEFKSQNMPGGPSMPGQPPGGVQRPELEQVGIELTSDANEQWLTMAYGRDAEVDKALGVMGGLRPSLVLIGRSGVGKTAIISEVVRRIRAGQCAEVLKSRQVWAVNSTSLMADQKFIGEWQGRMQRVVAELRESNGILFVEDIAGLVEAGRHEQNNTGMGEYLRAFIQSGAIVVIGESTPERWRYAEREHPGFVSQFSTLRVEPTDDVATLKIANNVLLGIEQRMGVRFAPGTSEAAVLLTNRFLPYRAQPGKAIRLIEQVGADALQNAAGHTAQVQPGTVGDADLSEADVLLPQVGPKEVAATFTRESGLPEFILADDIPLDLAAVRKHFEERVVGQKEAVDAMVNLIALVKTGLNDPEKPLGSFLFIGPTGVGKTQMVKTLAKYLFGNEQRAIRFDMSEYSDPVGARRLIGLPGSGEEGELTGRVREQPFCVVLLDEFEKAAPEIYDLFLQVLGEGRLTGATGATTSFQNAIVVMTSNLGASARDQRVFGLLGDGQAGAGRERAADGAAERGAGRGAGYWQGKVESYFRPEFVNRIDQIVPFQPLGPAAMRTIARRELGEVLLRQGVARRNLLVEMDDSIIDLLLEQGFSIAYGARPLKRAIEQRVVVPLARFLAGRPALGGELLRLGRDGDQVKLTLVRVGPEEGREQGLLAARPRRTEEKGRLLNYADLIEDFAVLRAELDAWNARDSVWELRHERDDRLARTSHPTFWDEPEAAQASLARFYFLERLLKRLQQLTDKAAYLEELARLVHQQRDAGYRWDLAENYDRLVRDAAFLEVELLCAHIEKNNGALLTLAPMPRAGLQPGALDEDTAAWVRKVAAMYVNWANRKGYDIEAAASLAVIPEAQRASEVQRAYPYRWQRLDAGNCDALVKAIGELPEVREIAILLSGANVYGFLKGEAGLHRRAGERIREDRKDDDRAKDERGRSRPERGYGPLQLVAVAVDAWGGDSEVLDEMIQARATGKSERGIVVNPAPSEIVRNYHVEGQRYVRDPRTKVRNNDLNGVLAGDLDDFILAYLREIEPVTAWEG